MLAMETPPREKGETWASRGKGERGEVIIERRELWWGAGEEIGD